MLAHVRVQGIEGLHFVELRSSQKTLAERRHPQVDDRVAQAGSAKSASRPRYGDSSNMRRVAKLFARPAQGIVERPSVEEMPDLGEADVLTTLEVGERHVSFLERVVEILGAEGGVPLRFELGEGPG